MMRKTLLALFFISLCPLFVLAQDVSAVEVFGGYSYLRTGNYDQDSHGWNTAVSVNLSKHFAVAADFAGHYDSYVKNNANVNTSIHTYLFGPQVNFRASERVNPFVHALFGAAHHRVTAKTATAKIPSSQTGFGMALGGGVDIKLNDSISWRMFQADYLLTRYNDPFTAPLKRRNIHNFRLSTGLVFQ